MPSPRSRPCWNPAVPPPPVTGAAVGKGLGDGLTVGLGDGLTVGLGDGLTVEVGEGLTVVLGDGLALGLGELLGEAEAVAEGLTEDDDDGVGNAPEVVDPEHAESSMEASMAKMPQPTAPSLALSPVPAVAARTFMEPPHPSGRWQPRCPRWPGAGPETAEGHKGKSPIGGTYMQWPFCSGILGYASGGTWGR
jgi:hypothetical protein